ncbi:23239_t:CDS:2, partial [Racocetra persica]
TSNTHAIKYTRSSNERAMGINIYMRKNLNLTVKNETYQALKQIVPAGQISSLVDNLLQDYLKQKKREQLIAGYKSAAKSKIVREEDKI